MCRLAATPIGVESWTPGHMLCVAWKPTEMWNIANILEVCFSGWVVSFHREEGVTPTEGRAVVPRQVSAALQRAVLAPEQTVPTCCLPPSHSSLRNGSSRASLITSAKIQSPLSSLNCRSLPVKLLSIDRNGGALVWIVQQDGLNGQHLEWSSVFLWLF